MRSYQLGRLGPQHDRYMYPGPAYQSSITGIALQFLPNPGRLELQHDRWTSPDPRANAHVRLGDVVLLKDVGMHLPLCRAGELFVSAYDHVRGMDSVLFALTQACGFLSGIHPPS